MVTMREVIFGALRRDPELLRRVTEEVTRSLRGKITDDGTGPVATVAHAAAQVEPIIADAVRKRPSRLAKVGLKSATLLASLAMEDAQSNRRLAAIARNSTVGIVFVDVAGFTALTEREGDESAVDKLERLQGIIERRIRSCRGEVVKRLGDGFLVAFPSASQAIRGAVAIRDGVRTERSKNAAFDLRLRIAVHAGEPLVEADDLLGHDVNLTARLLDHCKPDQILVSEAARDRAAKRLTTVRFGKRRNFKIRGLAMRVPAYDVERVHRSRSS